MKKKAVVVHSGGMDSSICLKIAVDEFLAENVLSLSFQYNQRHQNEIVQAAKIAAHFNVDHALINIDALSEITENSLTNHKLPIIKDKNKAPNTLVVGRNGLMARIAAIHAHKLSANVIFMGVIEVEAANSGYRDCTRGYMDLMEQILRIDLDDDTFTIRTPLVYMNKKETMALADKLGILPYLLEETITCYLGIPKTGCRTCPACILRNEGIEQYFQGSQ